MNPKEEEPEAIGWKAIDTVLNTLYLGIEPQHWGTIIPTFLGGKDPLTGISAYPANDPDHWHYITYGFSELYEKETDDPEVSGFGIELTFRLARSPGDTEARSNEHGNSSVPIQFVGNAVVAMIANLSICFHLRDPPCDLSSAWKQQRRR
jgi:hypothetical protein